MAQGSWIFLTVALCLSWLSCQTVIASINAGNNGPEQGFSPAPSGKEAIVIGAVAREILDRLYSERHEPFVEALLKRPESQNLTDEEVLWKYANPNWSRDGALSNTDLRLKTIDYIWDERGYQSIAVGVDPILTQVVIAGNIKALDLEENDTSSLTLDTYQALIKVLKACGGNCDGRGSTSLCNSFQDFTLIKADDFQHKIQDLSDQDKDKLLYALDQVGTDKLHGSESAVKEIHLSYKKWKSSISKRVMEAASKGTIISDLLGGTKSIGLEKTAISPKLMSQRLNQLQEEELESQAKEYEKFKTGKMDDPNSFKGFSLSQKPVQKVNLAMFGKNLIEGVLNQNADSVIAMGKLLGVDRSHNQKVEMAGAKGMKTLEAAEKILEATLKAAGPFVGSASNGISIYSFVEQINQLKYLQKFCQRNDSLVQDRLKSDCKFDLDSAIAKTVADKVENVNGVAVIVEKIIPLFGKNETQQIVLGVIDVLMEIVSQIDAAVKAVNRVSATEVTTSSPS